MIEQFIQSLEVSADVDRDWVRFVEKKKIEELEKIIAEENLDHDKTYKFIESAFRDGDVPTTGTAIVKILPPMSMFNQDNKGVNIRMKKKESVLEKFKMFFERFFDISEKSF